MGPDVAISGWEQAVHVGRAMEEEGRIHPQLFAPMADDERPIYRARRVVVRARLIERRFAQRRPVRPVVKTRVLALPKPRPKVEAVVPIPAAAPARPIT